MEVDCEILTMEVKKYPVIYNPVHENYKNRSAKIEAWKKVTEAIVGELYQTLDENHQNEIGKEVQRRWKTIKDTYVRSLKTQGLKSGRGASKRRPYVYHHQMSFLLPTIENRRTTGSDEENSNTERNDDDEQVPEENPTPTVKPTVPCVKKKEEGSNQTSVPPQDNENDADKLFLLSLLPKIKALNSSASLDFQIQVLQLLQGYLSNGKNLLN